VTVPPGVVTTTLANPAAWAPVTATIEVELRAVTPVAAMPPIVTVAPETNPVPVRVTTVLPDVEPLVGLIEVTVGSSSDPKVKPPINVALPEGVVMTTSNAPAAFAGVTAVIDVALTTFTDVAAAPPMVTVAPEMKFVPVSVIVVPPPVEPDLGFTAVRVGGGTVYVYPFESVAVPFVVATTTSVDPMAWGAVVPVMVVGLTTMNAFGVAPPIETVVAELKFEPVSVNGVPPAEVPDVGLIDKVEAM
jgi:hypothetical protein